MSFWVPACIVLIWFLLLLFILDGAVYRRKLLTHAETQSTLIVKGQPLVVLKEEEFSKMLFEGSEGSLSPALRMALADVIRERKRQNALYGEQFDMSLEMALTILIEEVGEFAQAIQAEYDWSKSSDKANTYEELIQVAAVATKVAEFIIKRDEMVSRPPHE